MFYAHHAAATAILIASARPMPLLMIVCAPVAFGRPRALTRRARRARFFSAMRWNTEKKGIYVLRRRTSQAALEAAARVSPHDCLCTWLAFENEK